MLYLFNTTIMPNQGIFINKKISLDEARRICANCRDNTSGEMLYISAIGHQGSADAFNVLGVGDGNVAVNRIHAQMQPGDQAIALKVVGRIPEGQILTLEELESIGFEFFHIVNIGAEFNADGSIVHNILGHLTPTEKYIHQ